MAVIQPVMAGDQHAPHGEVAIEMLFACHDRVERQCETLSRLVAYLPAHGSDTAAQQASRGVLRYFTEAAPHHHADEERDLFPMLLASASGPSAATLPPVIAQLIAEHRMLEDRWQRIAAVLQRIVDGQAVVLDAQQVTDFLKIYRHHMQTENEVLFPQIETVLSEQQIALLGVAMRRRRGIETID